MKPPAEPSFISSKAQFKEFVKRKRSVGKSSFTFIPVLRAKKRECRVRVAVLKLEINLPEGRESDIKL